MTTYTVYTLTLEHIIKETTHKSYGNASIQLMEIYLNNRELVGVGITTQEEGTHPDTEYRVIQSRNATYTEIKISEFYNKEGYSLCDVTAYDISEGVELKTSPVS